jgi:hypothetical protein
MTLAISIEERIASRAFIGSFLSTKKVDARKPGDGFEDREADYRNT